MSWFMASIYDRFMETSEEACLAAWRAELLAEVAGDVIEVGAGTGANLAHYPEGVARLVLTEPDRHMLARLRDKAAGRAELHPAPIDKLPVPDESFDVVVATLVLCSVPDQTTALREMFRVLRPGGRYVFLEHVAAENNPGRYKWQQRLEPVWKIVADNCHVTRRTADAIAGAGFEIESIQRESVRKAMPIVRPSIRGVARKPAAS